MEKQHAWLKRTLAAALALILALSATPVFAAGRFTDVADDAYYADAVAWAAANKITEGRGGGLFAPDATVTRAEAVTFLWRMAGEPAPAGSETFPDVEADPNNAWYKTAVQWAVENDITNGTGEGFSPTVTCSRGMILTMLYRLEGRPLDEAMAVKLPENEDDWTLDDLGYAIIQGLVGGVRTENAIPDVKTGDYYELPIIWAMLVGILSETQVDAGSGAVHPNDPCPRGEMAAFLYADAQYKQSLAEASTAYGDVTPVEVGTVPETVALDEKGVKLTVTGIEADESGDAALLLRFENGADQPLIADVREAFVNTYSVSPSTYIPIEEGNATFYENTIEAAPGETKDFYVGLNSLAWNEIDAVREVELQMTVYRRIGAGEDYEFEEFAAGKPVTIRTSLYDPAVSYNPEGTEIMNSNGLRLFLCEAANDANLGPQIVVCAVNDGKEEVTLELAELKLDGEAAEAYLGLHIPAGKRCKEEIYIDFDYENIPVAKEAALTFRTVDSETWAPKKTFAPVKVALKPLPDEPTGLIGLPNPWFGADTAEQAAEGAGVGYFMVPEENLRTSGGPVNWNTFRYMKGLAEAEGWIGTAELTVRKGLKQDSRDVSGDFTDYAYEWTMEYDFMTIRCFGNEDGKTMKAIWLSDNFSYSITVRGQGDIHDTYGIDAEATKALVAAIQ